MLLNQKVKQEIYQIISYGNLNGSSSYEDGISNKESSIELSNENSWNVILAVTVGRIGMSER